LRLHHRLDDLERRRRALDALDGGRFAGLKRTDRVACELAQLTLIDGSAVFTALNAETPWIITRP
jgi:hypothetical protein